MGFHEPAPAASAWRRRRLHQVPRQRHAVALLLGAMVDGASAAGGAFCGAEAPYCWGNYRTFVSSSSSLLSGLSTSAGNGKVAFGDIDGDGVAEAVIVVENVLKVYSRSGDSFVESGAVGAASSAWSAPELADLDGDGDLDLAVGLSSYAALAYFENVDGLGSFAEVAASDAAYPFNGKLSDGSYSSAAPAFADLDLDGDLDCVLGELFFNLKYFENVDGAWTLRSEIVTDAHYGVPSLGDVDGDGDFDLAIGNGQQVSTAWYGRLNYRENIGSSTTPLFEEPTLNPLEGFAASTHSSPCLFDADGDNTTDVVVSYGAGSLALLENAPPGPRQGASMYLQRDVERSRVSEAFALRDLEER